MLSPISLARAPQHFENTQSYALHYGAARTPMVVVVPDGRWPRMWRLAWPDGALSDMANLSRAKDAAIAICLRASHGRDRNLLHWEIPLGEKRAEAYRCARTPGRLLPYQGCAHMKPAHPHARSPQSRRLDRDTGRWRSAAGSTVMLEAMLKALARQKQPPPASSPQSPRSPRSR